MLDPKFRVTRSTKCHIYFTEFLSFFGNIQKLTIVVGHFEREDDDKEDVQFIGPIDVFKTCRNYENYISNPEQLQYALEVSLPVNFVSLSGLEKDLEAKRQWIRRHKEGVKQQGDDDIGEDEDLGELLTPQIVYKSAVTGGLKKHLDDLREEYQQMLVDE